MGVKVFYLLGIVVKQPTQIIGNPFCIKLTLAIAKQLMGSIITRDDDKRTPVISIENIVIGGARFDCRRLEMHQFQINT